MSRKKILCTFAHPDDEAFGPGGTIAKLAKKNNVYIVCATNGNANADNKLGEVRKKELQKSASILGVKKVFILGFDDGSLNNNLYYKLTGKIERYVKKIKPHLIITYDTNGVSGHLDHIAVSLTTSHVFTHQNTASELWYFCMHESEEEYNIADGFDYFIYMPPAYKPLQIDKAIDVSEVFDRKIRSMKAHKSQKEDVEYLSKMAKVLPKKEYFRVLKRNL